MNRREIVHLKQLRIFQNSSYTCLMEEVNDFITNKVKISDIQYSSTGGSFFYPPRYSVMVVIEEDEV